MGLGMEVGHKHRAASCEVFVFSGILGGLLWGGVCRAHAFDREQGRFVKSLRKSSALLVHRDPLDVVASAAFQSFGGNVPCPLDQIPNLCILCLVVMRGQSRYLEMIFALPSANVPLASP